MVDNKTMEPTAAAAKPDTAAQVPRAIHRFFDFSLLGMLASGYFAVLGTGFLDWPTAVLAFAGLCLRGLMIAGVVQFELSARTVAALAIGYIGFFPLDVYYLSGTFLSATVHMVFFLALLKLMTARTPRDYGYLKVIAGLELIAAAILSTGLSFLVFLGIFMLFAIATLASGEVRRASGAQVVISRAGLPAFSRRLGMLSGSLFAGILVMTVCFFFVLPRTARAALDRFVPQRYRLTGFSNTVTLGEIGKIKQNTAPVMHVRSFQGEGFLPVKWRGAALSQFDGKRWFNPPGEDQLVRVYDGVVAVRTATERVMRGQNLIYQVHLEPLVAETLFFAGTPETISIDVPFLRYSRGGSFHVLPRFGVRGLNYSVYGFLPDEWAEARRNSGTLGPLARVELLSLPRLDPRIPELAHRMTDGAVSAPDKARAIERHLRRDYGYTLDLLSQPVDDPLAYFLFQRKKGHCEYFASAMAVMLRIEGIPSRVITGFQSGVYNPMTGWQVIRASDAHSWVEAWIEGRGWVTFDPTPPDPSAAGAGWLSRVSLLADTASQFWQDWVMSYDLSRQVALYSRLQSAGRKLRMPNFDDVAAEAKAAGRAVLNHAVALGALLAIAAASVFLGPRLWVYWTRRSHIQRLVRGQGSRSDATLLYQQMLDLLEKRGIEKPPWLTPLEFARVVRTPALAGLVEDATLAYNELRFGGNRDAAPRMMRALEQMRRL
jgi:transglutaminase-like putative cysteine protease